jgi:hypothetical protein
LAIIPRRPVQVVPFRHRYSRHAVDPSNSPSANLISPITAGGKVGRVIYFADPVGFVQGGKDDLSDCRRVGAPGRREATGGVGMFSIVVVIMGAEVRRGPQDAENG